MDDKDLFILYFINIAADALTTRRQGISNYNYAIGIVSLDYSSLSTRRDNIHATAH